MSSETKPKDYWKVRRRLTITSLIFCYLVLTLLILKGEDSSVLHQTIASGISVILSGTILGYIGTSVYDDIGDKAVLADKDYWKVRRRIVLAHLAYGSICTLYLVFWGIADSKLHISIASDVLLTAVVVIVGYIGGATIQDKYMKKI